MSTVRFCLISNLIAPDKMFRIVGLGSVMVLSSSGYDGGIDEPGQVTKLTTGTPL